MKRWKEAARDAGSKTGATARRHRQKPRHPARPARDRAEYPTNGHRGAAAVLLRDRQYRLSTRRGGWPERLRSKEDCQPWNILAEEDDQAFFIEERMVGHLSLERGRIIRN